METLADTQHKVVEIKMTYLPDFRQNSLPSVGYSCDAYNYVSHVHNWRADEMIVYCLLFNQKGKLLGVIPFQPGTLPTLNSIYTRALVSSAVSIILATFRHDKLPNEQDLKLAKRLQETSKLLDIRLLDCIYFNMIGYYSLLDEDKL
ncbi:MAG: JAB domain-containing protein [Cyclobacteriaceae bacterium]